MPGLLLWEECVASGFAGPLPAEAIRAFVAEGAAMLRAAATDFARAVNIPITIATARHAAIALQPITGVDTIVVDDPESFFALRAGDFAAYLIIAPECDDLLARRIEQLLQFGGRTLGCPPVVIRLAGNKHQLCETLHAANVPVPRGAHITAGDPPPTELRFPLVTKPIDGAGSYQVCRHATLDEYRRHFASPPRSLLQPLRIEEFQSGRAASIACLCCEDKTSILSACSQQLTFAADGSAAYHGGCLPLDDQLQARAARLAATVVTAIPTLRGYVGIDLVLGNAADGSQDYVIEVNPRLTTSYLGLREIYGTAIAHAWWHGTAVGDRPPSRKTIEFDLQGTIRRRP